MKIFRFLTFIPTMLITAFILNIVINFVSQIMGFENGSKENWFLFFTKPFIIAAVSTILSIQVYPNDNKRVGISVLGVLLILFFSVTLYSMNELEVSIKKQVIIFVAAFIGYSVVSFNLWKQHYI